MALLVAVAAWALIAFGGSMRGASTPLAIVIFAALWLLVAGLAPVALALLLSGFVGTVLIMGVPIALTTVGSETVALITSEELAVLPLFLIMGGLATASGMANDLYRFAAAIFSFQRGGLALGSVMDAFTILLVTAPIVSSMIVTLGYDLLWWGVVMVVVIEIGVISPPFGMNLFVIKGGRQGRRARHDLSRRAALRRRRHHQAGAADPVSGAVALAATHGDAQLRLAAGTGEVLGYAPAAGWTGAADSLIGLDSPNLCQAFICSTPVRGWSRMATTRRMPSRAPKGRFGCLSRTAQWHTAPGRRTRIGRGRTCRRAS